MNKLLMTIHRIMVRLLEVERRLEPFFRRRLNYMLREPSARLLQFLTNFRRPDDGLKIA